MLYAKKPNNQQVGSDLQGVVVFSSPRTVSGVMKSIPDSVVRIAGDVQDYIKKCKELGDFMERGVMPLTQYEKGKRKAELRCLSPAARIKKSKQHKEKTKASIQDVQQVETVTCDIEAQQTLLTVSREVVPPLLLTEVASHPAKNWTIYAHWILDVLEIPFSTLQSTTPNNSLLNFQEEIHNIISAFIRHG
jgi:hypothetical protein